LLEVGGELFSAKRATGYLRGTEDDKSKIENLKFEKMAKRIRAEVRNAVHRRIRRKVRGTTERPRLATAA